MLPRNHPDRIQITFDPPLGGQCRAAPSGHPGAAPRPARTRPAAPRPGRCPGAGEHERQDDDAGRLRWLGATASTTDVLRTGGDGLHPGRHGQGAIHPGHLPAQLPVGLRQLDRVSRELLARAWQAGAGPGDGPLTIDLDSTICETYGLARPPPRLHRCAGLSPAAGRRRRHRRRADVPAARGPGQHRPRRRPLPAGDGGTGALRRGQRTTHVTGRQRVLHSWRGIRAARWMSASPSPSASTKACTISSRRYPKMPGRRFLTGWTVPPMWPRPPAPPSRPRRTPRRYGSSSGG